MERQNSIADAREPDLARVNCATFFTIPNWVRFIRRLFAEMNVVLSREQQQAINWVATGKVALCVFCRDEFAGQGTGTSGR